MSQIRRSEINIGAIFSKSWKQLSGKIALNAGLMFVYIAGIIVLSMIPFVGYFLVAGFSIGLPLCLFRIQRNEPFDIKDIFWGFLDTNRFMHLVIMNALTSLGVIIGLFLLIIPGIWFSISTSFSQLLFVFYKQDSIECIRKSMLFVKGRFWNIFLLFSAIFFVNALAAMTIIGILISVPFSLLVLMNVVSDFIEEDRNQMASAANQGSRQGQNDESASVTNFQFFSEQIKGENKDFEKKDSQQSESFSKLETDPGKSLGRESVNTNPTSDQSPIFKVNLAGEGGQEPLASPEITQKLSVENSIEKKSESSDVNFPDSEKKS